MSPRAMFVGAYVAVGFFLPALLYFIYLMANAMFRALFAVEADTAFVMGLSTTVATAGTALIGILEWSYRSSAS